MTSTTRDYQRCKRCGKQWPAYTMNRDDLWSVLRVFALLLWRMPQFWAHSRRCEAGQ
jgi:hypothetical protein